jgi:hypothetical protein
MAYADEIAAANRLKTLEERFAARNAVRAKYGMEPEKKTRGGLAEVYDRNKGVIQAALPALAGMLVPGAGALAGAITGGLARGLDRPGQGGIKPDWGQAARGAATGAALGGLGGTARGKLGEMLGGRTASAGALKPMVAPTGPSVGPAATPMGSVGSTTTPATAPAIAPVAAAAPTVPAESPKPGMLSRLLTTAQKPEVLAPLVGGVADVLGSAQDRAVKERQVKLEEEQLRMEQERKARMAELLMPLFQQQVTQYAGRR